MPAKRKQKPQSIDRKAIVAALLKHGTQQGAAEALGISRTSLYRKIKNDPTIISEYQNASCRALQKMLERAEVHAAAVIDELWRVVKDPDTPPGTRVYALNSIAAVIYKGENIDIQRKQLEIAQQRANDAPWN